jgi:hypothetical protein
MLAGAARGEQRIADLPADLARHHGHLPGLNIGARGCPARDVQDRFDRGAVNRFIEIGARRRASAYRFEDIHRVISRIAEEGIL